MTYKRNQRKKMNRRKREFPRLFKDGVAIVGSWNESKGPDPDGKDGGKYQKYQRVTPPVTLDFSGSM